MRANHLLSRAPPPSPPNSFSLVVDHRLPIPTSPKCFISFNFEFSRATFHFNHRECLVEHLQRLIYPNTVLIDTSLSIDTIKYKNFKKNFVESIQKIFLNRVNLSSLKKRKKKRKNSLLRRGGKIQNPRAKEDPT